MPGPEADRQLLIDTLREAGAIAKRFVAEGNKSWRKENGTPVSEGDLAVNAFLKERLCAARPGYGWLSEENEDDPARLAAAQAVIEERAAKKPRGKKKGKK